MYKYIFAGDSWALKGFTTDNYAFGNDDPLPGDVRLADHWGIEYMLCLRPGLGNLAILKKLLTMEIPSDVPIVWVYTEPGRDYGNITNSSPYNWITSENIFEIRQELDAHILATIRQQVPNPIALIGGLSDINTELAESLGFTVLHPSWQQWTADKLGSQWFKQGWGASDIGWRMHSNNVIPSKAATFAWDEQIKEWCWWEEQGYFCHEHPSPRSNLEFAEFLKPKVIEWLSQYE